MLSSITKISTYLKVTEEEEDEVWFEEAFDEDDKILELGEIARLRFKLGLLLSPDQPPS